MSRRRAPLLLRATVACLATSGCVVTPPDLIDEGFFACAAPDDCGPGQGCAEGNVYSPDFCRPGCDRDDPATCPEGVCTAAGACLQGCAFDADGSASGCSSDEFTCVRTDALRDIGVCFPVEGCSRTSDCDGEVEQLCLNDALGLPPTTTGLRFDNLYCTARPDDAGRCPTGYLRFVFADPDGGSTTVCYPPCDPTGGAPWCPPGTTCFRGFGELTGSPEMPPCLPGVWGLPCEDDTQCLIGRCLTVGDGRRACTETCQDAETIAGGCSALGRFSEAVGVGTRLRCEAMGGEDVCVPRYDLLALCDEHLECVGEGTECREVTLADDRRAHLCVRFCVDERDCAASSGGIPSDYRCVATEGPVGVCMRRRALGAQCGEDLDCREGVCCPLDGLSACQRTC